MSSSVEKSVKGATKLKLAPPKAKYIEHILQATRTGEHGVSEVFRTLQFRLRDSTWTIAYKALIVVHLMIREGEPNTTLSYVSTAPRKLVGVNQYTDGQWREVSYKPGPQWVQTQGRNIRHYSTYLIKRAESFSKARCDYVIDGSGRLKRLSVDKGLLRETEAVQDQISALLKCDFMTDEHENEISVTAFRLIVQDLRPLFTVMNEGTMNVLEHYFEMSRPDAERSLEIYKNFTKLTDLVIKFLNTAKQYEHVTKVETPKLKHAPTSLTTALEDYLNDRDFEQNRRQYLASKDGGKGLKAGSGVNRSATSAVSPSKAPASIVTRSATTAAPTKPPQQATGPSPDLIDFFDSIESNQQPMATQGNPFQQQQQPQQQPSFTDAAPQYQQQQAMFGPQQTGFAPQQTGFAPQQTGFSPQQNGFNQQQSGFIQQPTGFNQQQTGFAPQQTGINQFPSQQDHVLLSQQTGGNPFRNMQQPQQAPSPQQSQQPEQLQPQSTGAGFGGYTPQPLQQGPAEMPGSSSFSQQPQQFQQQQQTGGLQRQPTNPFRQSMQPDRTAQSSSPFGSQATGGNPFARSNTIPEDSAMQSFGQQSFSNSQPQPPPFPQQPTGQPQSPQPVAPQRTGTNPFARQQQTSSPQLLQPQATGSNPFRQSTFVNQDTGQGWQHGNQGTLGGFNSNLIDTQPVFPRPAGQRLGYGQQQQGFG